MSPVVYPLASFSHHKDLCSPAPLVDSLIHLADCKAPWLDQFGFSHLDHEHKVSNVGVWN